MNFSEDTLNLINKIRHELDLLRKKPKKKKHKTKKYYYYRTSRY